MVHALIWMACARNSDGWEASSEACPAESMVGVVHWIINVDTGSGVEGFPHHFPIFQVIDQNQPGQYNSRRRIPPARCRPDHPLPAIDR